MWVALGWLYGGLRVACRWLVGRNPLPSSWLEGGSGVALGWLYPALALGFSILRGDLQPKVIYGEAPACVRRVSGVSPVWEWGRYGVTWRLLTVSF
jgi:hypothetical protein